MSKRPSSEILLFLSRKRQCFFVLKKRIPVSAVFFFSRKIVYFQVLQAFARAEKKLKPNWREMFTEVKDVLLRKKCLLLDFVPITYQNVKLDLSNSFQVYDEIPTDLQKQMSNMEKHVEMYKDQYPLKVVPLDYRK